MKQATETKAAFVLKGTAMSAAAPSHTTARGFESLSTNRVMASNASAKNASAVYCLRSFRSIAIGTQLTAIATAIAATLAVLRLFHGSPARGTYAAPVESIANASVMRRPRCDTDPGTNHNERNPARGRREAQVQRPPKRQPGEGCHPRLVEPVGAVDQE